MKASIQSKIKLKNKMFNRLFPKGFLSFDKIHSMKYLFIILVPILFLSQQHVFTQNRYNLFIQNDLQEWIPVRMGFNQTELEIYNSDETIRLPLSEKKGDTLVYRFIDYSAAIVFKQGEDRIFSGYWINYESSISKKRTVFAFPEEKTKAIQRVSVFMDGNWKSEIIYGEKKIPALLTVQQENNRIYGTIRTNSGDYRYLEGKIEQNHFYLSSFAGNSAFYLSGEVDSITGEINGVFHNLSTNSTKFRAQKDDKYDLPNSLSITKKVNNQPFQLDLSDENGIQQNFKELIKGKVSIVSIFGTWCPNCVDEVNYFNEELIKKFPELKIIIVAYEGTDDLAEQQKRVKGFIQRKNIQGIQFLIAKKASEKHVLENFPMIAPFSGYPTAFLLNKKGEIVEIHTGFNGPATGILNEQYKEQFEKKIRQLMR